MNPAMRDLILLAAHHPEQVAAYVRADPTVLELRSSIGETALHYLVIEGQGAAASALLAAGADPDTETDFGETPMCSAARMGASEMIELLLSRGTNPSSGRTPPLHHAVSARRFDIAELLITRGASALGQDEGGESVLFAAVKVNSPELVALVLRHGARADVTDARGAQALHIAAIYADEPVCRLLLDADVGPMRRTATARRASRLPNHAGARTSQSC